jgi:phosphopantothenoylcysteine decarboxylase/phosphopantothenate--cysteine ligase
MANGLAGDAVTAACLATSAPVIVAPAMDGDMWRHPATQANVVRLRDSFGYRIVEPAVGPLASGQSGVGRLAELPAIVAAVVAAVADRPVRQPDAAARPPIAVEAPRDADLVGRRVVVTAGGTREAIDPVRFIGNRSSGRMGVAIAEAALDRGAAVTLVAADVSVPLPEGRATIVRVETADQLRSALLELLFGPGSIGVGGSGDHRAPGGAPRFDALVMAAAVADFTPSRASARKLTRGEGLHLDLEPTPDILAEVARLVHGRAGTGPLSDPLRPPPVLVGFAAETGSLGRAPEKLRAKGVDLLVANDVAERDSGFGSETNRVSILDSGGGRADLPLLPKRAVADRLLDRVVAALDARDRAGQTATTQEVQR